MLDFTAPEGVVLLPRKVVQCLYGLDAADAPGAVMVRYKRLEKGTYMKLQPRCGADGTAAWGMECGWALVADATLHAMHADCVRHALMITCLDDHMRRPVLAASCSAPPQSPAPPHCCAPEPAFPSPLQVP